MKVYPIDIPDYVLPIFIEFLRGIIFETRKNTISRKKIKKSVSIGLVWTKLYRIYSIKNRK